MTGQAGFFDAEERLRWLSASGDPLERLRAVVDFEGFRAELEAALPRADRSRGGRPPWDAVLMFRVLVLQALYTLSDDQTEYQLRDRLSFMRFVGLALQDALPNAKTIWLVREQLTRAGALALLFARFDTMLAERGFLAMGGQIVDATILEARRPRLTKEEKATLRDGGTPEAGRRRARARSTAMGGGRSSAAARPSHPRVRRARRPRSRCRCLVTRTTSASIAPTALSVVSSSPTRPGTMARSSVPCWIRATPAAASGLTRRIAAKRTLSCWTGEACGLNSSAPSRADGRCLPISPGAMQRGLACAAGSSMSSPPRSAAWVSSSAVSASRGRRRGSRWRT
jgi:transposase